MNMQKRAGVFVKGLQIWWEDRHPLDERSKQENSGIGHRNFALRPVAADIYQTTKHWAATEKPLRWHIKIAAVFALPDGTEAHEECEIQGLGVIADLAKVWISELREVMETTDLSMEHYRTTKFHFECLGV